MRTHYLYKKNHQEGHVIDVVKNRIEAISSATLENLGIFDRERNVSVQQTTSKTLVQGF